MTTGMVFGILLRRWYVVLAGLALTVGGLHVVQQRTGVYWGEVDVIFLAPKTPRFPNSIQQTSTAAIAVAGLMERVVQGSSKQPASASAAVSLAGQGISHGQSIKLFDAGSQWEHNFSRPVLVVQATGPDPVGVRDELQSLVNRIERELQMMQVRDGARRSELITASASPSPPDVIHAGGRPGLARYMTLVLGLWFTVLGAVAVDRLMARRGRRREIDEPSERPLADVMG